MDDIALSYGMGLFETMRVENQEIIWFSKHIDRMMDAAKRLEINFNDSVLELFTYERVKKEIDKFGLEMGETFALKIMATQNHAYIGTRNINYTESDYKNGFKIKTSQVRRNETSLLTYTKSFHYGDNLMERAAAKQCGFQEALFLNTTGKVTECASSNLFWVKNGELYTPDISCGILPGIMRSYVIDHYLVKQVKAEYEELLDADEVFLTNSIMEVMGVNRLDEHLYPSMKVANEIRQELQWQKIR